MLALFSNDRAPRNRRLVLERLDDRLNLSTLIPASDAAGSAVPAAESTLASDTVSASRAVDAINQFALDLYEHFQGEEGNLLLSPVSISTAMAMAYAGARGETAAEMAHVLNFGNDPEIHESFQVLLQQLRSDQQFELAIANATWLQQGMDVHDQFLQLISTQYSGDSEEVDFGDPETVALLNSWVSENTRGKITKMFSEFPDETRMVLANAIYFNAQWETEFDPSETMDRPFDLSDDQQRDVPTMHVRSNFRYTEIDQFQVLELPYAGNDSSMIVMLPARGAGNHATSQTLRSVNDWLATSDAKTEVDVSLPKFKNTVTSSLSELLPGMGMERAFDPQKADLTGIARLPLFIQDVTHKAVVEVDEQGTEAAAVTAVTISIGCFAAGTPVRTADGTKPIDQLQPGDHVLARDEHDVDGAVESKLVEEVFERQSPIIELRVQGKVIETTEEHPFYVKDRGWTIASELKAGDLLSSDDGQWIPLEKTVLSGGYRAVFNVTVADHHTYFIGDDDWGFSIWSHNLYGQPGPEFFVADRPFHYMIRDNRTDTILFMGRVNDPQGEDNDIAPVLTVNPAAAASTIPQDVNGDGDVTALDALVVINHLNRMSAEGTHSVLDTNTRMDTNGDGHVSAGDALSVINYLGQMSQAEQGPVESEYIGQSDDDDDGDLVLEALDLVLEGRLF